MSGLTFPSTVPESVRDAFTRLHEAQQDAETASALVLLADLLTAQDRRIAALEGDQSAENRDELSAAGRRLSQG